MIPNAEHVLDEIEVVWRRWKGTVRSSRSQTAMDEIHAILSDAEKDFLKEQGGVNESKTTDKRTEKDAAEFGR